MNLHAIDHAESTEPSPITFKGAGVQRRGADGRQQQGEQGIENTTDTKRAQPKTAIQVKDMAPRHRHGWPPDQRRLGLDNESRVVVRLVQHGRRASQGVRDVITLVEQVGQQALEAGNQGCSSLEVRC